MNEKNEREKRTLYEWGVQNGLHYRFTQTEKERTSYFIKRESGKEPYIREYGFETLPQIEEELDALWGTDKTMGLMKKVVGIAILKNKPCKINAEYKKEDEGNRERPDGKWEAENGMPTYIYNF